ncbi:MAG: EAL domain-containing protein, partial [Thermoplasmatota archaeon]
FKYKLDVLLCAFATYNETTDELFFGALLAVAVAAAAIWKLRVHQGLVLVAAGLAVIALFAAARAGAHEATMPMLALLVWPVAALVAALMERLEVGPAVVAGLSMGGYVALALLRRHRPLVAAVNEREAALRSLSDEQLRAIRGDVRSRGGRLAVDLAGSDYAGLRELMLIAPDMLKLDRALVHRVSVDPAKRALV